MIDAVKNAIVSWFLNSRIRMFVKSAVIKTKAIAGRAENDLPIFVKIHSTNGTAIVGSCL